MFWKLPESNSNWSTLMSFALKLRDQIKNEVISHRDLKALYSQISDASIHNGISRAVKSKNLVKLKRGLYLFSKNLRKGSVSKFLIANKIYEPSYVSFESALSYHGLIPEGVYTTTSACLQRKTKNFSNELGDFSYQYIPCQDFYLGVYHEPEKGGCLIATPIRALFDFIYLRKKRYSSIEEIENDLRIETSNLRIEIMKFSISEIESLAIQYKKKNVMQFCQILLKAFK
jgi:hypothetical protein